MEYIQTALKSVESMSGKPQGQSFFNSHSHDQHGFWGRPSATVDWCEPNYVWTHYIAEFFNTFSSFAMVCVGLTGIWLHYAHVERRYILAFLSVAVVGIGSAAFHGTLLFGLQMLDELPMIYSSLILAYCVIQQPYKKARFSPQLPIAMTLHALIATLFVASPALAPAYASPMLQFLSFHISFALLEVFLLVKATQLWREERDERMRRLHMLGCVLWAAGLVCWVLDYAGCEVFWEGPQSLRELYLTFYMWVPTLDGWSLVKAGVPNPQFHAWWHICASSGLYFMCLAVTQNRLKVLGKKPQLGFMFGIVPYVYAEQTRRRQNDKKQQQQQQEERNEDAVAVYDDQSAQGLMRRRSRSRVFQM